ncbi:hypothetical protein ACIQ6Y_32515 [Streptomyces sp. NPDC096205]|uniref:hypothetical protein n=1 Tax=Streptomyces sp. NPDC096205 TaxID=3366081 RepID=UPI00382AFABD
MAAQIRGANGQEIINPYHPVPDFVAKGFELHHKEQDEELSQRMRLAQLARPSKEEREYASSLQEADLRSRGIDADEHQKKVRAWSDRRREALHRHAKEASTPSPGGPSLSFDHMDPREVDHSFWEADGNIWGSGPFVGKWNPDGSGDFSGKETWDSGNLRQHYIGARWRLELQSGRMPPTSNGVYRSDPFIRLNGKTLGYVGAGELFHSGDRWCNCWLHTKQSIYQLTFVSPGSDPRRFIATKEDVQCIFFIERTLWEDSVTETHQFPGQVSMPSLTIFRNDLAPADSLWVELEVGFHIQLEGDSLFWFDNNVQLQTFQWPLLGL